MAGKLKFLKPKIKAGVVSILIVAALTFVFSTAVRFNQYRVWKQSPSTYFAGSTPMMTTVDAFYWIRMARDYENGRYKGGQTDPLRFFPTPDYKYPDTEPLLCFFLRVVSKLTGGDLYVAGIYLIPFLAGLFVIPFIIYFYRMGYPALGITGALIATFCHSYHVRSCLGRVDTDSLNLFFPFMASMFILFAGKSKFLYLYALLAGVTLYIFNLWYPTVQFIEMYFVVFAIYLFVNKADKLTILKALAVFLFSSSPANFAHIFLEFPAKFSLTSGTTVSLLIFYLSTFAHHLTSYFILYSSPFVIPYKERFTGNSILLTASLFLALIPVVFIKFTLSLAVTVIVIMAAGFYSKIKIKFLHHTVILLTTIAAFSFERWTDVKTLAAYVFTTYAVPYLSAYVFPVLSNYVFFGRHSFMGIEFGSRTSALTQVSELYKYPFMETMAMVLQNPVLTIVGLVFFTVFAVVNFKKLIPISPVLLLGMVAFSGSNRFVMYLAPFVGVGYGYFVTLFVDSMFQMFKIKKELLKSIILYASAFIFFLIIIKQTAFFLVPSPSIPTNLYWSFQTIGKTLPERSVIFTWWDFGYALEDITGFATYHDGGSQETIKTLYIAHALTSNSQVELYNILSMLTKGGSTVTEEQIVKDQAVEKVIDDVKYDKSHILFTMDMIMKLPAIFTLRGLDAIRGEGGSQPYFVPLSCQTFKDRVITCEGNKIDLNTGTINGRSALVRSVMVENGQVLDSREYGNSRKGLSFEALAKDKNIFAVFLFNDEVFNSNFNQMYLLGNYNKDLYTQVYNAWPTARVFKAKTPVLK
ncbi:MAG: hypothetical protein H7844_04975 [Nitrospirae bacterium YQR-1]